MRRIAFIIAFGMVLVLSSNASAQTYVDRGITASSGSFDVLLGPVPRPMLPDAGLRFESGGSDLHLDAGLAYGVTEQFELGAYLLRFRIFGDPDLDSPTVWGAYQFLSGDVDIALRVSIPVPIFGGGFYVNLDVPIVFRLGSNARFETGVGFSVLFEDPVISGAFIPLRLVFNVTPAIFLGFDSGLSVPFSGGDGVGIPLGAFLGYSITPNIDFAVAFRWGRAWRSGDNAGFEFGDPSIGLGLNLYEAL